jgi:hypothetical protein
LTALNRNQMQVEHAISAELRYLIRSQIEFCADGIRRPQPLPGRHRQEAWLALRDAREQCRLVTREQLRAWLLPFADAGQGKLGREDFEAKLGVVALTVSGFPGACFTDATRRQGLTKWRWFPSPADVCELLEPIRSEIEKRLDALETLLRSPESDVPKPELTERERMTQEERDAVVNAFHIRFKEAVEAARSPTEQIDAVSPPEPRYFTTEQLAEAYRREGLRNPRDK